MNPYDASASSADRLREAIARRVVLAKVEHGRYVYELLGTGRVLTWKIVRKAGGKFGAVYELGYVYDLDDILVRHVRKQLEAARDHQAAGGAR